jgi:4-amino-4-deoxy-L-arabinose transferase-like glycosyltransferase
MKIYWSAKSIPELSKLSETERKKVWKACYLQSLRLWQTWLGAVACGAAGGFLGYCLSNWIGEYGAPKTWQMIVAALAGGLAAIIFSQVQIALLRPYIRGYLDSNK